MLSIVSMHQRQKAVLYSQWLAESEYNLTKFEPYRRFQQLVRLSD